MSEARGQPFVVGNRWGRGRPKGSRNRSKLAVEALFAHYGEAVAKKCIAEAMRGDPGAMRLCMDRIIAPRRGVPVQLALRGTATAAEVDAASQKLWQGIAAGQVTPEQGEILSNILETRERVIGIRDFDARLQKVEQKDGERERAK